MVQTMDKQLFDIRIYRGSERVGRIYFRIGIRELEGDVTFDASDAELKRALKRVVSRSRRWRWPELTRQLIDQLSLTTGGRFVLRFGTTPSEEGRGTGDDSLRRAIDRAVNE
jgi:hypothetical protein